MTEFNEVISDTIRCNIASHGNAKFAYVCSFPECSKVRVMCNHCFSENHKEHQRFAIPIDDIANGRAFQTKLRFNDRPDSQELKGLLGINEKNYLIFRRTFDKAIKDLQDYFSQVSYNLNQIVLGLKNKCLQLAHDKFAANPLAQLYDYYYFFQSGGELKNIIEKYLRLVHDEGTTAFLLDRYFNSYQKDEDVVSHLKSLFEQMMNKQEKIFDDAKFDSKPLDDLFAPLFHSMETVDSSRTLLTRKLQNYTMPELEERRRPDGMFTLSYKRPSERPRTPKRKIFEEPPSSGRSWNPDYSSGPHASHRVTASDLIYSPRYRPYTERPLDYSQADIRSQRENRSRSPHVNQLVPYGRAPRHYNDDLNLGQNAYELPMQDQMRSRAPAYGIRDEREDPARREKTTKPKPTNRWKDGSRKEGPPMARSHHNYAPPPEIPNMNYFERGNGFQPDEEEFFEPIHKPINRHPQNSQDQRINGVPTQRTDKTTSRERPQHERTRTPETIPFHEPDPRSHRQNNHFSNPNGALGDFESEKQQLPLQKTKKEKSRTPLSHLYDQAPQPIFHPRKEDDEPLREISPISSPRETTSNHPKRKPETTASPNLKDNVYHDSYDPEHSRKRTKNKYEQDVLVVKKSRMRNKRMQTEPELFEAVDFMNNSTNTSALKGGQHEKPSVSTSPSQPAFYPSQPMHELPNEERAFTYFMQDPEETEMISGQAKEHHKEKTASAQPHFQTMEEEKPQGGFNMLFQDQKPVPSSVSSSIINQMSRGPRRGRSPNRAESPERDRSVSASCLSVILADNNATNYFSVRSRDKLIKISKTIVTSLLIYLLPHEKTKGEPDIIVCMGDSQDTLLFFGDKGNFLGTIPSSVNSRNPALVSFTSKENEASETKSFLLTLTPKCSILIVSPKTMSPIKEVSIASNTPGFNHSANFISSVLTLQLRKDPRIFPNKTKTMPDPLIITSDTQKSLKVWDWQKSSRVFETFSDSEFTCVSLIHLPRNSLSRLKLQNVEKYDFFSLALTTSKSKKINFWSFTLEKPVYNFPFKFGGSTMTVMSPTVTYSYFEEGDEDAMEMRRETVERFAHLLMVFTTEKDLFVLNWTSGEVVSFHSEVHKGFGIYDCTFWLNMKAVAETADFLFITAGDDSLLKVWKLTEEGQTSLNLVQEIDMKNIPIGKNLNFLDSLITDEDNRLKMNLRLVCASISPRTSLQGVLVKTIRILENV